MVVTYTIALAGAGVACCVRVMKAARAREVFRGAIQRMGITADTAVGEE
jgi:hypothetical protein